MTIRCRLFGCNATHERMVRFKCGTEDSRFECVRCKEDHVWPQHSHYGEVLMNVLRVVLIVALAVLVLGIMHDTGWRALR